MSNGSGDSYPVSMIPYSHKAYVSLISELVTSETVGKRHVYNVASAFDTEASSFTDLDDEPVGLCYIWMFGIGSTVVYGRYLDEFVELMQKLNAYFEAKDTMLFVYVHFLKYDFSFIKKLFDWDDVFIKKNREPLYARWHHVEFRDSLVLAAGKGLDYIGKKVLRRKVYKATGDLNYELIRTSETPMTQQELHYCEMDIRVLCEYITEKIEDDGSIIKIPYTNTGYVRNYVRAACFENRGRYMDYIDGLTMTPDCYLQCEKAYSGGASGPNIKYVGQIVEDLHSYDIKSSYPYVMVALYYPAAYFQPLKNKYAQENLESLVTSKCCLFRLEIFNLQPATDHCFPISYHKCNECIGGRVASGRVISAAYVSINVTELDYFTIKRFYALDEAEEIRVTHMRIAPRGFLPKPIVKSILKFFFDKTTLDGVADKKIEYMIAKNMLNSVYGMMVEKVVREEYIFTDEFESRGKDYVGQVSGYNENRNRFLFYPWGVWVTAHARFRLYDAIYNVGDDWRYCDTDSVKFVGDHERYFKKVNAAAVENLSALSRRMNIPMDEVIPRSPNGEQKFLGVWEHEYDAYRFKTVGSKRYLTEYKGDGEHDDHSIELTVAGSNKIKTLEYLKQQALVTNTDIFKLFDDELVIPAEYAQRTVSKFVDKERSGYITDYTGENRWFYSKSGVYIEPASYSFSITDEMYEAIIWLTHDGHFTEGEI